MRNDCYLSRVRAGLLPNRLANYLVFRHTNGTLNYNMVKISQNHHNNSQNRPNFYANYL